MTGPIRPDEVAEEKQLHIPDVVFDAFNAEIALHYVSGRAQVKQKDVIERLVAGGMSRSEIFENGWLNVEDAYRSAGWNVEYDKPGWNETYNAFFVFKKKS